MRERERKRERKKERKREREREKEREREREREREKERVRKRERETLVKYTNIYTFNKHTPIIFISIYNKSIIFECAPFSIESKHK